MAITERIQHAWNAFMNKDPTETFRSYATGPGYSVRPDRPRLTRGNEKSIVTSIYNRISLDVAAINLVHARLDDNGRYTETMKTSLQECLSMEANIDQTGRALIQDAIMSMLDEGCVAIVPVDTTLDPNISNSYDINSLRVGRIVQWYPQHIRVSLYNEKTGLKEEVTVQKKTTAIIENPFYAVMNEPNSTSQRLIRKLNILDLIDEQSGTGKLDLIIQLPYVIKTQARKDQAEIRRKEMEDQLNGSKLGIAYTDGTEKIIQLNRPINNNLMSQIEYLTNMLYGQLSMHQSVLDGTADAKVMLNYFNGTIEKFLTAIVDEMNRKFLTKTARTQLQSIVYIRDPFKLVPISDLAEIADKFTRNEILSSNDVRQIIGFKPSKDPNADVLRNKNLNAAESTPPQQTMEVNQNGETVPL